MDVVVCSNYGPDHLNFFDNESQALAQVTNIYPGFAAHSPTEAQNSQLSWPSGLLWKFSAAASYTINSWVAKESRHIDPGGFESEVEFHKRSLVSQSTCAAYAADFNDTVDRLGLLRVQDLL